MNGKMYMLVCLWKPFDVDGPWRPASAQFYATGFFPVDSLEAVSGELSLEQRSAVFAVSHLRDALCPPGTTRKAVRLYCLDRPSELGSAEHVGNCNLALDLRVVCDFDGNCHPIPASPTTLATPYGA